MSRPTKDWEWTIDLVDGKRYAHEDAKLSVLMDIRDELKHLNKLLNCDNFLRMPRTLLEIRRNTAKRRRKKK